jgi:uncharacterized YigZ family protein
MMIPGLTVSHGTWSELSIRHSRFISCAFHIENNTQFTEILQQVVNTWPKASHYAWAYVLTTGQERMSDDGEPQGTAGIPTLFLIQKRHLVYTAIVTVRYFGGTKLGSGGLVRAYRQACENALSHAQFGRQVDIVEATVTLPYSSWQQTHNFLVNKNISFTPVFLHHVEIHCEVPEDDWPTFCDALQTTLAPDASIVESHPATAISPWVP